MLITNRKGELFLPPSEDRIVPVGPVFDLRSAFAQVLADVTGMPRGYNTEGDVLTQTIDGRDLNEMWDEFQGLLASWNARRDTLTNVLTFGVNAPVEDVPLMAQEDFEEASEFGEPKGIRGGGFQQFAYDFKWYDLAIRYTWKYLAEATAAQVESQTNMALEADNRLVFSRVLKAIFNSAKRSTDIRTQAFNVYPFYNGDSDGTSNAPPYAGANYPGGTNHNHYLATNNATLLPSALVGGGGSLEEHLRHHGYGRQAGATMVLLANPQEVAIMRPWRVATNPAVYPYDFVPSVGSPPWLLPTNTGGVVNPQGGSVPATWNGLTVAGQYGPWLVVETDFIPAGYIVAFATGGENNASNPVGIREHQNSGLRGLRLVKGRDNDYPLVDSFYQRGFGTGVRHRGAGAVLQVVASTTYTVPAAYA